MPKRIIGIIPARYDSTRFPGKPLTIIHGKSMVMRVYEQASKCSELADVYVATDDARIEKEVLQNNGKVVMTGKQHLNGTTRCREALEIIEKESGEYFHGVINIQGDEPYIDPAQISAVAELLQTDSHQIATLYKKLTDLTDLNNPNIIKVVKSSNDVALYFSRSVIPFDRAGNSAQFMEEGIYNKHIGIYGYQRSVLRDIVTLNPSPLEMAESLEQLRWLENGYKIKLAETTADSHSVDVPEDVNRFL